MAHTLTQMSLPVGILCQGRGALLCRCALGKGLPGNWQRRSLSDHTPAHPPQSVTITVTVSDNDGNDSNNSHSHANDDVTKLMVEMRTTQ